MQNKTIFNEIHWKKKNQKTLVLIIMTDVNIIIKN